jgi:hypothetical protein
MRLVDKLQNASNTLIAYLMVSHVDHASVILQRVSYRARLMHCGRQRLIH